MLRSSHFALEDLRREMEEGDGGGMELSLIHISEPTRRTPISYAVFCLKKKKIVCSLLLEKKKKFIIIFFFFFFLMIRRPPRSTRKESSAASDVYKRQLTGYVSTWEQIVLL